MSEHNQEPFRDRNEELENLGRQITDVREALREIAVRMSHIERHVKRSFGVTRLPGRPSPKERNQPAGSSAALPSMSPEQAMSAFDGLVAMWKEQSPERVDSRLRDMATADLLLMAHELGISFPGKPSRNALAGGIVGRINESILLSRNTNLTLARSESTPPQPGSEAKKES